MVAAAGGTFAVSAVSPSVIHLGWLDGWLVAHALSTDGVAAMQQPAKQRREPQASLAERRTSAGNTHSRTHENTHRAEPSRTAMTSTSAPNPSYVGTINPAAKKPAWNGNKFTVANRGKIFPSSSLLCMYDCVCASYRDKSQT